MPDLFSQYERLALTIARSLWHSGSLRPLGEVEDAEQASLVALLQVIQYHDEHPGLVQDFPAFAAVAIRQELLAQAMKTPVMHQAEDWQLERLESRSDTMDHAPEKDSERIREALQLLDPKARRLLEMYYGIDGPKLSAKQIGKALGVSRQWIHKRLKKSTEFLKDAFLYLEIPTTKTLPVTEWD